MKHWVIDKRLRWRNYWDGRKSIRLADLGDIANRIANDPRQPATLDWWLSIDRLMREVHKHVGLR